MEARYLNQLREDARLLVTEIEQFIGQSIRVEVDQGRDSRSADDPEPIACTVDAGGVTVLLTRDGAFPEDAVVHELLHIHRFTVGGIPQIVPCSASWTPERQAALTLLDNFIEHLHIVPYEIELRPSRQERWRLATLRTLDRAADSATPRMDRDATRLLAWVFAKHVIRDEHLVQTCRETLNQSGLADRADSFLADIVLALPAKSRTIQVVARHLGLDVESVCLESVDVRSSTCRETSLRDSG